MVVKSIWFRKLKQFQGTSREKHHPKQSSECTLGLKKKGGGKCAYIFRIKQLENNKKYIHMESRGSRVKEIRTELQSL